MSFLKDLIFGSKSKATTTMLPSLSPEQQRALKRLFDEYDANGSMFDPDVPAYGGRYAAELSDLEKTSLAGLEEMVLSRGRGEDALRNAREKTALDLMSQDKAVEYYDTVMAPRVMETVRDELLPDLTRRFAGNAAWGSDRRQQELQLGDRVTEDLAQQLQDFVLANRDIQLRAAALGGEITDEDLRLLSTTLAAGAIPRSIEDRQLAGEYAEFGRQQDEKNRRLEKILALLGVKPHEYVTTVTPGQSGLIQEAARGVGTFLGSKIPGI